MPGRGDCVGAVGGAVREAGAELTGQRNAIDGRIVEVVAEIDRDELWGAPGARSVAAVVAWAERLQGGAAGVGAMAMVSTGLA